MDTNTEGNALIHDFVFASTGEYSSVGTANAVKYLIQPSESILKRLLGGTEINEELVTDFKKLGELRAQGKAQEIYELVQTFPEELRNQKEILLVSINASLAFDENIYRSELTKLDKLYGQDPRLAFMLIDHYFFQKDWPKAIKALEQSKREWADDGALNVIAAEIQLQNGKMNAALKAVKHAIEKEPESETTYWYALSLYNQADQFDDMVEILSVLTEQFSYEFSVETLSEDPDYNKFAMSEAFKAWSSK